MAARLNDKDGFRAFCGDDALLEELVSDLNGDGAFWREVFDGIEADNGTNAKRVIARLAALIFNMIDAAVAAFKGGDQFGSKVFIDDAKCVRVAFRDAMRAYAKDKGVTRTAMCAKVLKQSTALSRER